jgi:hypothetical protein
VDYDISEASFDELVSFCFDHPVDPRKDPWYFDAEVLYDPTRNVKFYIELFHEPRFLLERFSRVQLDQGFWAISTDNLQGNVYNIIFEHPDIPLVDRETCIRAMYELFGNLYAVDQLDQSGIFWWHHMTAKFQFGYLSNEEIHRLADVTFGTLLSMLDLDSLFCKSIALDGLRKLRHMETESALLAYLNKHPKLDTSIRQQALRIIRENPGWNTKLRPVKHNLKSR